MVGVLVLGMAGVPAHPGPFDLVAGGLAVERLPELEVLDRAGLPLPAARLPSADPLGHSLHEILAVRDEDDATRALQLLHRLDRALERHPVVGRRRVGDPEVAPLPGAILPDLDEPRAAARVVAVHELVAETGLVRVDVHE